MFLAAASPSVLGPAWLSLMISASPSRGSSRRTQRRQPTAGGRIGCAAIPAIRDDLTHES